MNSTTRPIRRLALANLTTLAPLGALVLVVIIFSILAPSSFPTTDNLRNIAVQSAVLAILATGLTLVTLLGEIDLAFAAVASVTGLTASLLVSQAPLHLPFIGELTYGGGNDVIAVVSAIVLGALFGLVSGVVTTRLGVPSFVGSLALLLVAQGLSFYWAQGQSVPATTHLGEKIATGSIGPFPTIALFAAAVMLVCHVMLTRTRLGRYVYMVGANRQAAILSGLPASRILLYVFTLAGALYAMAGLLNVGRLGSAQADTGLTLLLPVFAAVVLGGNSLFGGIGGIPQTLVGVLLYSVLQNGLDQSDLDIYIKPLIGGWILVAAVVLNVWLGRIATRAASSAEVDAAKPADPGDVAPEAAPTPSPAAQPSGPVSRLERVIGS
jgi:ribose transport system permease protein